MYVLQFNAIVWNVDPEIAQIGPITIRYYGILFALSFILGYNIKPVSYTHLTLPTNREV